MYAELEAGSGPNFAFERFAEELRQIYRSQGRTQYCTLTADFAPRRLKYWLQDPKICFLKEHPEVKKFKLHSLRATAISPVRQAGIPADKGSVFFGVNVQTMAKHYEALDKTAIADEVANEREKVWRKCGDSKKWGDGSTGG